MKVLKSQQWGVQNDKLYELQLLEGNYNYCLRLWRVTPEPQIVLGLTSYIKETDARIAFTDMSIMFSAIFEGES